MHYLEINKEIFTSKEYAKFVKNSINISAYIDNWMKFLPHGTSGFAFLRLNSNDEFNLVTSLPERGRRYLKNSLWEYDIILNTDYISPMYNQILYMPNDLREEYKKCLNRIGSKSCLVISYELANFKDSFIYFFQDEIALSQHSNIYPSLHNIAKAFYHLNIEFKVTFKLPELFKQSYKLYGKKHKFNAFKELIDTYNLSSMKSKVLLALAFNMPLDIMSVFFCRSRRTIEKNIDDLRELFNVKTKFELCQLLNAHYLGETLKFIKEN